MKIFTNLFRLLANKHFQHLHRGEEPATLAHPELPDQDGRHTDTIQLLVCIG